MKINGSCHCGRITFEAEVDPQAVRLCHCTDCQALSGSAFRWVTTTQEGSFRLLTGEPKRYLKTAESGSKRVQAFCGECGSPIYSSGTEPNPTKVSLRVGTVAQRAQLIPGDQIWLRSAQAWIDRVPGLGGRQQQ